MNAAPQMIEVSRSPACWQIKLKGHGGPSCINEALVQQLMSTLDQSEQDPACRMVVIRGSSDVFCLGMDFEDVALRMAETRRHSDVLKPSPEQTSLFMHALKRISDHSRVVACLVEGKALGGGVGLVAACDLAVATESAEFGLPELLWGLVPANIMPFLVRRMGYQKAYRLALTTQNIRASEAQAAGLVDAVAADPDEYLRRLLVRIARIEPASVLRLKRFMRKMWLVDEAMEQAAIDEFATVMNSTQMQDKLMSLSALQQHASFRTAPP